MDLCEFNNALILELFNHSTTYKEISYMQHGIAKRKRISVDLYTYINEYINVGDTITCNEFSHSKKQLIELIPPLEIKNP
jgi:hypothetical protein